MFKKISSVLALIFLVACSGAIVVPIEDLTRAKTSVTIINGFDTTGTSSNPSTTYKVKAGDTLYAVAWRFGWDYKALAQLNNISPPYVIYVDEVIAFSPDLVTRKSTSNSAAKSVTTAQSTQVTKTTSTTVTPSPATKPAEKTQVVSKPIKAYTGSKNLSWQWPVRGNLIKKFNPRSETSKGIDVQIAAGNPVKAAAKGQVVYAGNGIQGYGNLLIIKHNDTYLSAYAYNSQLLVSEGDLVNAGQQVALSGKGPKFAEMLHFEIRKDGKPVDPLQHLP